MAFTNNLPAVIQHSLLTDYDTHLFRSGTHYKLYEKLGAHLLTVEEQGGVQFGVWAPNATKVTVIGDFNGWHPTSHTLYPEKNGSGIWEGFIPEMVKGSIYKYRITAYNGKIYEKADPFACAWEIPPRTSSVIWDLDYKWKDKKWLKKRKKKDLNSPISIYEMHFSSWRHVIEEKNRPLTYLEMAEVLPDYLNELEFTHVEFMPLLEHPYDGSWGYQLVGYFAPTSRFGTPQDFMFLVDTLHQAGIGVIMDWVPSHFPYDAHGLGVFDGTHLFEHADPRKGFHPDWKTYIFNYGRKEVCSFLISSAMFWIDKMHMDGLRVDAVASMLYLDYSRDHGQWIPNKYGGNENLEAAEFLKACNIAIYSEHPDVHIIAEESTSWPGVSHPVYNGGLGFGMKWMMGWMHDTLNYFQKPPIYRSFHQDDLTFSMVYAFSENFMLPFSHDEVVHGKGSLLSRMPGKEKEQFANLRLMYAYMFTHPGSKLLFMGSEFAQKREWNYQMSLDWHLLNNEKNKGVQNLIKDLNHLYKTEPALHENQFTPECFEWLDLSDNTNCVISYLRKTKKEFLVIIANLTPKAHSNYQIGIPKNGIYTEIFNSDDLKYGGTGFVNQSLTATTEKFHKQSCSIKLNLPPLGMIILKLASTTKD